VMSTQGGRGCFVITGAGSDLGKQLLQCCWRDAGERRLAGEESEGCVARRLGSQPDANFDGLGVLVPLSA
jgi:hypothetical protein